MKSSLLSPFGNTSSLNQADLNGDGYLDMITTNPSGWVGVMFGKPGGTFNAGATYALGSFTAQATAAGDFNGDGILDIAVLNYGPGSVSVMLGRGNGLFLPIPVRYKSGAVGTQFAVGDVNRDGKLDILVAQNPINNSAPYGLLLGNSDGTFQPGKLLQSICDYGTNQLMLVDLNGDGNLDAVTQSGVSLGNGDGTFRKWMSFSTSDMDHAGQSFALGDFNNDGKLDLALSDWRLTNTISIHLGNGTGQFNASSSYHYIFPLEIQPGAIAVGRFTRDGNLGVVAGSREQGSSYSQRIAHGMFKIFAGQGDGTLLPGNSFQLLQDLSEFSVADFNGDGLDDVAVFNQGSTDSDVEGLFELLSLYTSRGDGTLLGPVQFGAPMSGICASDFNNDGAIDLAGVKSAVGAGVLMNSNGTFVKLQVSPSNPLFGETVVLEVQVTASFRFSGTLSGSVGFYDNGTQSASSGLSSGMATVNTAALSKGKHTLTAHYSGNTNFNPHTSNPITITVQ